MSESDFEMGTFLLCGAIFVVLITLFQTLPTLAWILTGLGIFISIFFAVNLLEFCGEIPSNWKGGKQC